YPGLLDLAFRSPCLAAIEMALDDYLLHGFMPAIYAKNIDYHSLYRNYVSTYLEKDVRQITKVHDLLLFQKFFRLCASRIGQLFSHESLANEVGVSSTTISNWLSVLEASYIIFRLPPYYENFGKRLIKSSKLYFFDVGLVSYLLGIENTTQIARDPLRGNIVENLVILELLKARFNKGLDANLYFFRDSHGNEIDIIYKHGHELIPIEVKSALSFNNSFLKGLTYFDTLAGDRVPTGFICYAGQQAFTLQRKFQLINFKDIANKLISSLE
ncbi:MAG: ATP-binding protein, partial [Francisellaceae bacterium]